MLTGPQRAGLTYLNRFPLPEYHNRQTRSLSLLFKIRKCTFRKMHQFQVHNYNLYDEDPLRKFLGQRIHNAVWNSSVCCHVALTIFKDLLRSESILHCAVHQSSCLSELYNSKQRTVLWTAVSLKCGQKPSYTFYQKRKNSGNYVFFSGPHHSKGLTESWDIVWRLKLGLGLGQG